MNRNSEHPPKGFTLVITLALMVLLTIIAVGLLSLSAVSLRGSTQAAAKAEAQSNARLALMLAIAELQKYSGADTRITAPSRLVEPNSPPLVGVWKSWEGSDHDNQGRPTAPDYASKQNGRFLMWLVSGAKPGDVPTNPSSLALKTPGPDNVPLLSIGTLGKDTGNEIHLVPQRMNLNSVTTGNQQLGSFAWWISGENQKARVPRPYKPDDTNLLAGYSDMMKTHAVTNPKTFGLDALAGNPSLAERAVSLGTADLIADPGVTTKPRQYFLDLSADSLGLLTNAATGGWKKDMSILTEKWDNIYATSGANATLPLFRFTPTTGATSQVPKPAKPNATINVSLTGAGAAALSAATPNQSTLYPWSRYSDLFIYANQRQPNYYQAASASWQSLVAFATSYKQFSENSGVLESPFVWDRVAGNNSTWMGGSTATVLNFYNYYHTQRLHPQIARFQAIVFARAVPTNPPTNPARYNLRMMWVPVITLWNPHNVGLTIGPLTGTNEELLIGWTRSLPIVLATVLQASYPMGPSSVPNSAYRFLSPGNFQYLDVNGNFNADGYDYNLSANTLKGYPTAALMDVRTFGATFLQDALKQGKLTFKPGETKVFSPEFPGHVQWSGSVRLTTGFNNANILGFEWGAANSRLASDRYWFLMNNDRVTRPYKAMNAGLGFAMSFGLSSGGFYTSHPSHVGVQRQFHNMSTLAPQNEGNAYWPSTDVDEVGYSIGELASGPWIPIFSVSMGPRTTIGTGSGTQQNRPTKGVLQSNPLAAMALVDPASGDPKAHPANGTFDITYHSMSIGSNLTPNLSTSKGFIATGYQSGDGLSRLIMSNIPLRPMASLVELEGWNPRGNNPYPPFQSRLIGNSDATPLIPKDKVVPPTLAPAGDAYNMMHDDAYCANHLLFDDWFVSSIAPDPQKFGSVISRDIDMVYRDFLKGDNYLPNRSYRPIRQDQKISDAEATARIAGIINSKDGWLKVASRFEVEGMFNVNSASVPAWKALLGHAKNLDKIAMHGANGIVTTDTSNKNVVSGSPIAPDVEAGTGAGFGAQFDKASEYTGYRHLSDNQINDLAEKVVEQVRLRGPFLSLSEFINRQLSDNKNLAMAGAIQSAIDNMANDPMAELRNPANKLSDATMPQADPKLAGAGYQFPESSTGASAYGAPGWIRQADILRPLAPVLSVRDDTFTIRAYGDSRDPTGKVVAKAWCEAVVKRTRDFTNQSQPAESAEPPPSSDLINTTFGRRYEIVSFRWLNAKEV